MPTDDLDELSAIRLSLERPSSSRRGPLIVRASGTYGHGSGGNSDARYLDARLAAWTRAYGPSGVVLDFRELRYEWGDMMTAVIEAASVHGVECTLVVSDLCRAGLESLVRDEMRKEPADYLFEDVSQALARVERNISDEREAWDLLRLPAPEIEARLREAPRLRRRLVDAALLAMTTPYASIEYLFLGEAEASREILHLGVALLRSGGVRALPTFERGLALIEPAIEEPGALRRLSRLELEALAEACARGGAYPRAGALIEPLLR